MASRGGIGQVVQAGGVPDVTRVAALRIAEALQRAVARRGSASLALSGGNTPRDAYARMAADPAIDWSHVHVFWVDERAVPPENERSNYRWAKETLLDHAPIPADHVHRMRAESAEMGELAGAAREYEALIRRFVPAGADGVPELDVAVMGIGDDGHTASLFPGELTVAIVDRLVAAVPAGGAHEARMTITRPLIEHARDVFYLVEGAGKAEALSRVVADEGTVEATPARIVRSCRGAVEWIVDDTLYEVASGAAR